MSIFLFSGDACISVISNAIVRAMGSFTVSDGCVLLYLRLTRARLIYPFLPMFGDGYLSCTLSDIQTRIGSRGIR